MKTNSEHFLHAQQIIPGGVNSPVRAFKAVGGNPVFIDRAKGAYLYDVEGKRYIDYVLSWGPMILGHAPDEVIDAVSEKLHSGLSFGAPTAIETELAEKIRTLLPSMERLRFVSSGTEATMSAIRLARGFTGRDNIVKFEGCYHGHSDSLLIKAGSGALTFGVPSSPGVPECLAQHTLTLTFNDAGQVENLFREKGDSIACIIVEPVTGNMNCIPPKPGFLETLRRVCDEHGTLLIFDEVMTGFRVSPRSAQGLYDVNPDLTTLGKVIGGGMPVGAFGGRQEIMEHIAPTGPVYQAGTLSGNPVAMAAGLATLEAIAHEGFYEPLFSRTKNLCQGIEAAAVAADIPLKTNHVGSMWGMFFTNEVEISNYKQVMDCDIPRFNRFFHGMLEKGVYLAPASFEAGFMSASHSEDDINETIQAAADVFSAL